MIFQVGRVKSLLKNKDGHINQNSHKIQEAGFGYYLENLKDLPSGKKKKGLVVEVKGVFPFTLSESNGIGVVKKIYALKSSSNEIQDKELKDLACKRIQSRINPSYSNIDEYYTYKFLNR